jgi:hypothetical protein
MGDLDEAIREHLDLKRRRGADPAEVAREEQEALSPVTRGHAVVTPQALEQAGEPGDDAARNGDAQPHAEAAAPPQDEDLGDATQEFRVVHDVRSDDWLEDDDA